MSPIRLSSLETGMKILSPDCYNLNNLLVLAQTFGSLSNSAYFKNALLTILYLDSRLERRSVSYTMVYRPCFEKAYLNKRNQSGCLREMSFLKAGFYCTYGTLANSLRSLVW